MKYLKGFLFVITGLFLMVTLFSLLIPSKVFTTRALVIHAPQQDIFNALKDINQWKLWSPILRKDAVRLDVPDSSGKNTTTAEWTVRGAENKILITEVFPNGIKLQLYHNQDRPVDISVVILPTIELGNYQVELTAITSLKWYPWEKFGGIFINDVAGPGYEATLQALKSFTEKTP